MEIKLSGKATVTTLIDRLDQKLQGSFKKRIINSKTGKLLPNSLILVNGRSIKLLKGIATPLNHTDTVAFIPPAGGGDKLYRWLSKPPRPFK